MQGVNVDQSAMCCISKHCNGSEKDSISGLECYSPLAFSGSWHSPWGDASGGEGGDPQELQERRDQTAHLHGTWPQGALTSLMSREWPKHQGRGSCVWMRRVYVSFDAIVASCSVGSNLCRSKYQSCLQSNSHHRLHSPNVVMCRELDSWEWLRGAAQLYWKLLKHL